ncbi:MAG: di-trans,poly-cis-decaprenylcistransferase [Candidatus Heimdallarchaeota archaeon]|nr:di-trans,poly-cis-decaprenylcistransferase [Candidatus Heimdallarchaeota archaeon]
MVTFMHWLVPKFIYKIYEKKLKSEIKEGNVPEHIGIILDGNRRASRKLGVVYEVGYELGAEKLEKVLDWIWDLGVKVVSCWIFSTDNFSRDKKQVDIIMNLAKDKLIKIREDPRIHKNRVSIKVLGRLSMLPKEIQEEIKLTESATKEYNNYRLNICMAYGGRAEIVDALKRIIYESKEGNLRYEEINEELITKYLYTNGLPDPELIIRTSGEERLSGFLLWQSAYSEYYFAEVNWPLFRKIDLWRAVRTYQRRQRRFGE